MIVLKDKKGELNLKYIRFNEKDYNELNKIFDKLYELSNEHNELDDLFIITEELATLQITLGREFEILENEVFIKDINKYKLVNRKALVGDIVQIINTNETSPFNQRHNNRFFKVTDEADKGLLEWVVSCVIVGNMCLYDTQYVVLESIKNDFMLYSSQNIKYANNNA